jgi:hypothetical protein
MCLHFLNLFVWYDAQKYMSNNLLRGWRVVYVGEDYCCSVSGKDSYFSLDHYVYTCSVIHPASYQLNTTGPFIGINLPQIETEYSYSG